MATDDCPRRSPGSRDPSRPEAWTVRRNGRAVDTTTKHQIAYLPEERGLYRRVSAVEALVYYGELKGMPTREARAEALALLDRVELKEWALKPVQSLSKGMQ